MLYFLDIYNIAIGVEAEAFSRYRRRDWVARVEDFVEFLELEVDLG
jgi:hypothetical protein